MSEFTFLFRGRDPFSSQEERLRAMEVWYKWFKELSDKGHLVDPGRPLEPGGKVVSGVKKIVTDGPFSEIKDVIGGYIIVEAADIEHATDIAKGSPVLDIDGSVEIRPVQKVDR